MSEEISFTPEQYKEMDCIVDEWTKIATRTDPIDSEKAIDAIQNLYKVAGYKVPTVVVTPSPLATSYVFGAAAWIWFCRDKKLDIMTADNLPDNESIRLPELTEEQKKNPYIGFILKAIDFDHSGAKYPYTRGSIPEMASDEVERLAKEACEIMAGEGGIKCSARWSRFYQGGGMWAGYCAYAATVRDVVKLDLPEFEKYQAWEDAARHSGLRLLHEEFCLVIDNPTILSRDEENRPHNLEGPSHAWADGWKIYNVHGVTVPEHVVMNPSSITVEEIDNEANVEVKRIMIDQFGPQNYLIKAGAQVVSSDDYGVLLRREVEGDEPIVMVRVLNSTPEPAGHLSTEEAMEIFGKDIVQKQINAMQGNKEFLRSIGVKGEYRWKDYFLRVPPEMKTAHEAVAWTFGMTPEEYHPDYQS